MCSNTNSGLFFCCCFYGRESSRSSPSWYESLWTLHVCNTHLEQSPIVFVKPKDKSSACTIYLTFHSVLDGGCSWQLITWGSGLHLYYCRLLAVGYSPIKPRPFFLGQIDQKSFFFFLVHTMNFREEIADRSFLCILNCIAISEVGGGGRIWKKDSVMFLLFNWHTSNYS